MAPRMLRAQGYVGFEVRHEHFGETAADDEAVHLGQRRRMQGIDIDQFHVGGAQAVDVLTVIKAEGLIVCNADADPFGGRGGFGRQRCAGDWRAVGDRQQATEIDLRRHPFPNVLDPRQRGVLLVGRHQAEMALGDLHAGVVLHRADHLDVGVMLDHRAQLGFMAAAAEVVEDDAGDANVAVECLITKNQRGHPARHAARVDHQHHRRAEQLGERRVAVAAVEIEAVVQTLVAFDQADARAGRGMRELLHDLVAPHHVEIEVVAGPLRRHAQPQRIDVVGPLLERLHRMAARVQGGAQAERQRGLAGGFMGGGNEDAGHRLWGSPKKTELRRASSHEVHHGVESPVT